MKTTLMVLVLVMVSATAAAKEAHKGSDCIVVKSFETDSSGRLVIKTAWLCEKGK